MSTACSHPWMRAPLFVTKCVAHQRGHSSQTREVAKKMAHNPHHLCVWHALSPTDHTPICLFGCASSHLWSESTSSQTKIRVPSKISMRNIVSYELGRAYRLTTTGWRSAVPFLARYLAWFRNWLPALFSCDIHCFEPWRLFFCSNPHKYFSIVCIPLVKHKLMRANRSFGPSHAHPT